jgi:hypothetical protein
VVVVVVRFLEMHMYITSALQKTDMKAVGLQLALELLHEKVKRKSHQQKSVRIRLNCNFKHKFVYKFSLPIVFIFMSQKIFSEYNKCNLVSKSYMFSLSEI